MNGENMFQIGDQSNQKKIRQPDRNGIVCDIYMATIQFETYFVKQKYNLMNH